jgi:PleD family two-component response regulator
MSTDKIPNSGPPTAVQEFAVTVLLVDDQMIIAEAVRRMLASESDICFHYCSDPTQTVAQANAIAPTVILQDLLCRTLMV